MKILFACGGTAGHIKVLVTTAMFSTVCIPTWAVRPVAISIPNRSRALTAIMNPRQMSRANSRMMSTAPTKPISSQMMAKTLGMAGGVALVGIAMLIPSINERAMYRINVWKDPFIDPQVAGFQTIQSLYAIGSGGLTPTPRRRRREG